VGDKHGKKKKEKSLENVWVMNLMMKKKRGLMQIE